MTKPKKTAEQLAEEHWLWFIKVVGLIAVEFFIHGYKHGKDTKK